MSNREMASLLHGEEVPISREIILGLVGAVSASCKSLVDGFCRNIPKHRRHGALRFTRV